MQRLLSLEITNITGGPLTITDGANSQYSILNSNGTRQRNKIVLSSSETIKLAYSDTAVWSFEKGSIRTLVNAGSLSVYVRAETGTLSVPFGVLRLETFPAPGNTVENPFWVPEAWDIDSITVMTPTAAVTAGTLGLTVTINNATVATYDLKLLTSGQVKSIPLTGVTQHQRNYPAKLSIASNNEDLVATSFFLQIRYKPLSKNQDFFAGNAYFSIPGSSGDYLYTEDGSVADYIFNSGLGGLKSFSITGWWARTADGADIDGSILFTVANSGSTNPRLEVRAMTLGTPRIDFVLKNNAGLDALASGYSINDPVFGGAYSNSFRHVVMQYNTGASKFEVYLDGTKVVNQSLACADEFSVATDFVYGSSKTGTLPTELKVRNPMVFDQYLTSAQVLALYLAGPDHDPRVEWSADWDASVTPVAWWPGDGDVTEGTDREGACNLVLGGATTVVDS